MHLNEYTDYFTYDRHSLYYALQPFSNDSNILKSFDILYIDKTKLSAIKIDYINFFGNDIISETFKFISKINLYDNYLKIIHGKNEFTMTYDKIILICTN